MLVIECTSRRPHAEDRRRDGRRPGLDSQPRALTALVQCCRLLAALHALTPRRERALLAAYLPQAATAQTAMSSP